MKTSKIAVVWFRNDLRLQDNPALIEGSQYTHLIPLYIWDPQTEAPWDPGAASRWWVHHSLKSLNESLLEKNSKLLIVQNKRLHVFKKLLEAFPIHSVFWNRAYEPLIRKSDEEIETFLTEAGVQVKTFSGNLIFEPGQLSKEDGKPYQVYTAFWKCFLKKKREIFKKVTFNIPPLPESAKNFGISCEALKLLPKIPWDQNFYTHWKPGEEQAHLRWKTFLNKTLPSYKDQRDFPSLKGTSSLSPHLHFGEIHPLRMIQDIEKKFGSLDKIRDEHLLQFCKELLWREFAYHLLFAFPSLADESMKKVFDHFPWKAKGHGFEAWKKGQTGYPIVDAGMRQLWSIGWMHNRVRMIVASFLTKDLNVSWKEGARWFWDTLVDADLANNTQGWQWTAGCGFDAAPFFRIFNPVRQGEKFDPKGDYIRQWCPELKKLPPPWIHKPWLAPDKVLAEAGVKLGKDYPHPIIEHDSARKQSLRAFKALKN